MLPCSYVLTDDVKNISLRRQYGFDLVGNITQASIRAINYAKSIGQTVVAMHVSTLETREKDLEIEQEFKTYFPDVTFCQYRIKLPWCCETNNVIRSKNESGS